MVNAGKLSKGDRLGQVDHAAISYPPFRKNFYIEVPELAKLEEKDVAELRKEEGMKVRSGCCMQSALKSEGGMRVVARVVRSTTAEWWRQGQGQGLACKGNSRLGQGVQSQCVRRQGKGCSYEEGWGYHICQLVG